MTSPWEAQRQGFRWLPTAVIAMVVLAGIILAWVHFGWFVQKENTVRQQQIQQNSPAYQSGWYDKLGNDYSSMLNDKSSETQVPASDLPQVKAAVLGDAQSVCYDYTKVNPAEVVISADITAWYKANCSGPAVSLSSGLRK